MSTRYNPFEELERMFDRMSRQLAEASESWDSGEPFGRFVMGGDSMRVDLVDSGEEFVATVDLPGFEREDIDVRVANHALTIDAERDERLDDSDEQMLRRERHRRSLHRTIELPEEVEDEDVTARMKNGVLTITLPKSSMKESRAVDITVD